MGLIPYIQPLTSTATESAHTGDLVASRVLGIPRLTACLLVDRCWVVSVGLPRTQVGTPPLRTFLSIYISFPLAHPDFWVSGNIGFENLVGGTLVRPNSTTFERGTATKDGSDD